MKSGMPEDPEFEAELRRLRPAPVREEVLEAWQSRCNSDLASSSIKRPFGNRGRQWSWLLAALVLLTGFVGVFAVGHFWGDSDESSQTRVVDSSGGTDARKGGLKKVADFRPEGVERQFVSASDDGVVVAVGDVPYRQVRYQLMDTFHWENPQDGSRLQMMIPRQEVLLLPVVTY